MISRSVEDLSLGRWSVVGGSVENLSVGLSSIVGGQWVDGGPVDGLVVG